MCWSESPRAAGLAVLAAALACPLAAGQFNIPDGDVPALIAAINEANATPGPNTINLATGGLYTLTEVDNTGQHRANGLPVIASEITINGNGATIERSDAAGTAGFRILFIGPAGRLTLNEATIRKGGDRNDEFDASGIYIDGGVLTLNHGTISGNRAFWGLAGGVINRGTMTATGSTISGNSAGYGRAGAIYNTGTMTMTDTIVDSNSALGDGGIVNAGGTITLTNCTISGNGSEGGASGITNGGTITMVDSTVTGNRGTIDGFGAILNSGDMTVTGSTITDNEAGPGGRGGGIANSGTLSLTACVLGRNAAYDGGAIWNSGILTATGSVLSRNEAVYPGGGGLGNHGSVVFTNCTIMDNTAELGVGGGIINGPDAALELIDCTVSGNRVDDGWGGGILNTGTATLINTTISGNRASGYWARPDGGGLRNGRAASPGTLRLIHCTITDNESSGLGGGIHNDSGSVSMTNTIVANSAGGDIVGPYSDDGHNIVQDGSGITHPTSMSGDPVLGPLADNGGPTLTHALLPGSPAIDAGDCAGGTVTHDQRGVPRPQGNACDIGAFELDCYPDCDGDGTLDFQDFLCFQNAFLAGDPYADCNGDGVLDFFDFLCFQNEFLAGCP